MAKDNDIIIKLRIDGQKNIEVLKSKADKTAQSVDRVGKSAATTDRQLKGAAQASSNTTKNFSKMAQGVSGGLVPAYATLAANIFAVTAVFRFLQSAADFRVMTQGQLAFAAQTGSALSLLTKQVQAATDGQLAFAEASQAVAIGKAAGLTTNQLTDLARIAKDASLALGRDLTDSFNRLTRGAIKAEPELLDELGIIVRLNDATKEYAKNLNLDANSLSVFQKSQAVVNAVIDQGNSKFRDLGIEVNAFTKLAKSFDDVLNSIKDTLAGVAEFMAKAFSNNPAALGGIGALAGTQLLRAMTPQAPQFDMKAATAGAQADVSKFYTGKLGNQFKTGNFNMMNIKTIQRSLDSANSKVLRFNQLTRFEAVRSMKILELQTLLSTKHQGNAFSTMFTKMRAELLAYELEHGKTMGRLKFMSAGFMKFFSGLFTVIGFGGLALSLVGIVKAVSNMFKSEEALEFEKTQERINKQFKNQAELLRELNKELKIRNSQLQQAAQISNFIANFSFRDVAEGLNKNLNVTRSLRGMSGFSTRDSRMPDATTATTTATMADTDLKIVQNTLKSLTDMGSRLSGSAKIGIDDLVLNINTLLQNITDNKNNPEKAAENFAKLRQVLEDLGSPDPSKGLPKAVKDAAAFSQQLIQVDSAGKSMSDTLAKLRTAATPFAAIRKSTVEIAGSFTDMAGNIDYLNTEGKTIEDIFDKNTVAILKNTLGSGKVVALLEQELTLKEVLVQIAEMATERGEQLLKVELRRLNAAKELKSATAIALQTASPLQKKEIQNLSKQADLNQKIQGILDEIAIKSADETKFSEEQIQHDQMRVAELMIQRDLLAEQLTLQHQLTTALRSSAEGGLTEVFSSMIKGERPAEGRTVKFGKTIADALTNVLAKDMAKTFMDIFSNEASPADRIQEAMVSAANYHGQVIKAAIAGEAIPEMPGTNLTGSRKGILSRLSGFDPLKFLFGNKAEGGLSIGTMSNGMENLHATQASDTGNLFQRLFMSSDRTGDSVFKKLFGGDFGGAFGSFFGLAKGGIMGYQRGGIAKQPTYLVGEGKQHEAVVPLPDNRSIPVNLKGSSGTNNVNVNVDMGSGKVETTSADDGFSLGQAISAAVVKEIEKQQRPGGQLSSI